MSRNFVSPGASAVALLGTLLVLAAAIACGQAAPINAGASGGAAGGGQAQLVP